MKIKHTTFIGLASLALLGACGGSGQSTTEAQNPPTADSVATTTPAAPQDNVLSADEQAQGFQLLFDGQTLGGWHTYLKDSATGWQAEGGVLSSPGGTGDLVSNQEYDHFELRFDWKIGPGGNSGVFYYVLEDPKYKSTYESGPEYQLIDDQGYKDPLKDVQKSGANYDMQPPSQLAAKPPGEWNAGRIVVDNGQVEHWLNDTKVVAYTYGDEAWKKAVAASKFAKWPYATPHPKGKLALQDHGDPVSFKNVRIKVLPAK
jgi:hypothetical protein